MANSYNKCYHDLMNYVINSYPLLYLFQPPGSVVETAELTFENGAQRISHQSIDLRRTFARFILDNPKLDYGAMTQVPETLFDDPHRDWFDYRIDDPEAKHCIKMMRQCLIPVFQDKDRAHMMLEVSDHDYMPAFKEDTVETFIHRQVYDAETVGFVWPLSLIDYPQFHQLRDEFVLRKPVCHNSLRWRRIDGS